MNERIFGSELKLGMASTGGHVVSIPDNAHVSGKKPYDFGFLFAGQYLAIECKQVKDGTSLGWRAVEVHQLVALEDAYRHGAGAFVVVNFRRPKLPMRTQVKYDLPKSKLNRTWAIPVKQFRIYYNARMNVDLEWFLTEGIELEATHIRIVGQTGKVTLKPAWDVRSLLINMKERS